MTLVLKNFDPFLLYRSIKRKPTRGMAVYWTSIYMMRMLLINGFVREHGKDVIHGKLFMAIPMESCSRPDTMRRSVGGVIGYGWTLWAGMSRRQRWQSRWPGTKFLLSSKTRTLFWIRCMAVMRWR